MHTFASLIPADVDPTGVTTAALRRMLTAPLLRASQLISDEGLDRFTDFATTAAYVDPEEFYMYGSEFVARVRAVAACLPADKKDLLVSQVYAILGNDRLDPAVLRRALFPQSDPLFVQRLRTGLLLVAGGTPVSGAAAAAGVHRNSLTAAVSWLGTVDALMDRRLDLAIALVSEGATTDEVAALLDVPVRSARRIRQRALDVLNELAD